MYAWQALRKLAQDARKRGERIAISEWRGVGTPPDPKRGVVRYINPGRAWRASLRHAPRRGRARYYRAQTLQGTCKRGGRGCLVLALDARFMRDGVVATIEEIAGAPMCRSCLRMVQSYQTPSVEFDPEAAIADLAATINKGGGS